MKKIFSLIAALMMAGSMFATIRSYTFKVSELYPALEAGTQVATVYSGTGFTVSTNADGDNGKIYGTGDKRDWRLYQKDNACVSIVPKTGYYIYSVSAVFSYANNGKWTYGGKTILSEETVYTGNPDAMRFRVNGDGNGQIRITEMTVWVADKADKRYYGELDEEGETLTLKFDEDYEGEGKLNQGDWIADGSLRVKVKKVVLDASMKNALLESGESMFAGFTNLEEIENLDYLNTTEMTTMQEMFYGCEKLKKIDVYEFRFPNVKSTEYMFGGCTSLEELDFYYDLSTPALTTLYGMFADCEKLKELDVSWLNTDNVTSFENLFRNCKSLKSLDLSNFNTENAVYMTQMFAGCESLEVVDLSSFKTKKVTTMQAMFKNCKSLISLDLTSFKFDNVVYVNNMFQNCESLVEILCKADLTKGKVSASWDMFAGCVKLTGDHGTTYVESPTDNTYAHLDGGTSNKGYFSSTPMEIYGLFNTYSGQDWLTIFYDRDKESKSGLTPSQWRFEKTKETVIGVVFDKSMKNARPTSLQQWFAGFESVERFVDFDNLKTGMVEDMSFMFSGCSSLKELDLRTFDFTNIYNTTGMFLNCSSLERIYCTVDLSGKVISDASISMFEGCTSLVGDEGTKVEDSRYSVYYAHVDEADNPGYFCYAKPSIYGVFGDGGETFTLYYNGKKEPNNGIEDWWEDTYAEDRKDVLKITLNATMNNALPTSAYDMFYDFENATEIEHLDWLNTSEVTDMFGMFANCRNIKLLDLSKFNTAKVTYMDNMFDGCSSLKRLDLSTFDTDEVEEMGYMFSGCDDLTYLDLTGFKTDKVVYMSGMFAYCSELQTIVVSDKWNTDAVIVSDDMFDDCYSLVGEQGTAFDENEESYYDVSYAHIDGGEGDPGFLSSTSATPATIYGVLDYYTNTLTIRYDNQIDANSGARPCDWYNSDQVYAVNSVVFDESLLDATITSTEDWFAGFINLSELVNPENLNTEDVTEMEGMFDGCSALTELDLTMWDVSWAENMKNMFRGCTMLETLDITNWAPVYVRDFRRMFYGCSSLTTIYCDFYWRDDSAFDPEDILSEDMFTGCMSLVGGNDFAYEPMSVDVRYARPGGLDYGMIVVNGYFTQGKKLYGVFGEDGVFTLYYDVNIKKNKGVEEWWDNAYEEACGKVLKASLDKSMKDAKPTSTAFWFAGFLKLQAIDHLDYLNTEEVTDMSGMFANCYDLKVIDVSKFKTDKVESMVSMFNGCASLKKLDLSIWNTPNVEDMGAMFASCEDLTWLDLQSFNTGKVENMNYMFSYCYELTTIFCLDDWNTANVTNSEKMFYGCSSLVGEKGTEYDSENVDVQMAHLDEDGNAGYFSKTKPATVYGVLDFYTNTLTIRYDDQMDANNGARPCDWYNDPICWVVNKVVFDESLLDATITNTEDWFVNFINLQTVEGTENLYMGDVKEMSFMFANCSSLTSLDLSAWDVSNAEQMTGMFAQCEDLVTLDITGWNPIYVSEMDHMFHGCKSLKTIICKNDWLHNTQVEPEDLVSEDMFAGCIELEGGAGTTFKDFNDHLDIFYARPDRGETEHGFFTYAPEEPELYGVYTDENTQLIIYFDKNFADRKGVNEWWYDSAYETVTTAIFDESVKDAKPSSTRLWFSDFEALTTIEHLDWLDVSEVADMSYMFAFCESLETLDLTTFNIANVYDYRNMFENCSKLKTIYTKGGWLDMTKVELDELLSANMFYNCTSLVGGAGTTYDESHINILYARPDGGESHPGYFTKKVGTGVESIQPSAISIQKVLRDGHVLILREGRLYDMNGRLVK